MVLGSTSIGISTAAPRFGRLVAGVLTLISLASGHQTAAARPVETSRHALLVGCSNYDGHPGVHNLLGPKNDVAMFAKLLSERFAFPSENIVKLVSGVEGANPPTLQNISESFDDLVDRVSENDQVVILLSGHGVQTPIPDAQTDALHPANPEPDGLDEVFLPEDFTGWADGAPVNALKDDTVGAWLEQIRDCGASVWVVFDCCHSGTMSRGVVDGEIDRGVDALSIGVPREALERAAAKAAAVNLGARSLRPPEEPAIEARVSDGEKGSLIAFYAAQAFETAPELPRPRDAPRTPEHYHGLLSYVLVQALSRAEEPLTYRELCESVLTRYRAERGSRTPTPLFDGDLSRPVLAGAPAQGPTITVLVEAGSLAVDAGQLMGLEPGAVLSYGDPVQGHLVVERVTATSAVVSPCAFAGLEAVPADKIPHGAVCRVVARGVGEMRLALAAIPSDEQVEGKKDHIDPLLSETLEQLVDGHDGMLRLAEDAGSADWLLRLTTDETTKRSVELLRPGDPNGKPVAVHPMEADNLPDDLLYRDLKKAFVWSNVWRIAGSVGRPNEDLRLDVKVLDRSPAENRTKALRPGDRIEVRFSNDGFDDVSATFLFLDAEYGITEWFTSGVEAGSELRPFRVAITGESAGPEGIVVFAQPLSQKRLRPNLAMLLQSPIGSDEQAARSVATPRTAFDRLLQAASTGVGARSAAVGSPATPEIIAYSWVTKTEP